MCLDNAGHIISAAFEDSGLSSIGKIGNQFAVNNDLESVEL